MVIVSILEHAMCIIQLLKYQSGNLLNYYNAFILSLFSLLLFSSEVPPPLVLVFEGNLPVFISGHMSLHGFTLYAIEALHCTYSLSSLSFSQV